MKGVALLRKTQGSPLEKQALDHAQKAAQSHSPASAKGTPSPSASP